MANGHSDCRKVIPRQFQLDTCLVADTDHRSGKRRPGFETEDASYKEDRTRVRLMKLQSARGTAWTSKFTRRFKFHMRQRFKHLTPPTISSDDVDNLCARILTGSNTLASSAAMRQLRLSRIGAVLECFEAYHDDEIVTFTILNSGWAFTADELQNVKASTIKKQLRTHLLRIGAKNVAGPLVAFLHGEFEPSSGKFILHFHGVTTVEKYRVLLQMRGKWGYDKTPTGAVPIRCEKIKDRARQFSYLLKSYWPQRQVRLVNGKPKRDRTGKRIHEPYATVALLWLDRQSPADTAVLQHCRFLPNGQLRAATPPACS